MKELKWKHDKDCCNDIDDLIHSMEIHTPYPKKRNGFERFLNRYNHIMEFARTIFAIITLTLQLIIIYRLFN